MQHFIKFKRHILQTRFCGIQVGRWRRENLNKSFDIVNPKF